MCNMYINYTYNIRVSNIILKFLLLSVIYCNQERLLDVIVNQEYHGYRYIVQVIAQWLFNPNVEYVVVYSGISILKMFLVHLMMYNVYTIYIINT